jgi:OmpR family response regulator RpaB
MSKLKILVAEDNKVTQKLYENGLPDTLFDRRIVSNGDEAIAVYKEWQPDIVVLDFIMPSINGFGVLSEIREVNKDKSTTVIMVSSVSEKTEILACAKLGIQGYIVKPFNTQTMATTIVGHYNKSDKKK